MLKSSATSSRASMLAAASGLCRERKSDTSTLAKPSDEERMVAVLLTTVLKVWVDKEESALGLTLPAFAEDFGKEHDDDEVAKFCGGSGGCDSGGGDGSDVCSCVGAETNEGLFERLSWAESLQEQWHWQDSSCLMMMTGRLRPICWTELPEDKNAIIKLSRYNTEKRKWHALYVNQHSLTKLCAKFN